MTLHWILSHFVTSKWTNAPQLTFFSTTLGGTCTLGLLIQGRRNFWKSGGGGQVEIQSLLKVKGLLLFHQNLDGGGQNLPFCPPCNHNSDGSALQLLSVTVTGLAYTTKCFFGFHGNLLHFYWLEAKLA